MSGSSAVPGSAEAFAVATPDGAVLPVYALGGPANAPGLLFGHANGLAAGSYAPWLRTLAGALRGFAFDARGHGGSRRPARALATGFALARPPPRLAPGAPPLSRRPCGAAPT